MSAPLRTSTLEMSHDEWLAARKLGIGSSDAAAAAGLSPYKTPYQLWEEKCGIREPDDLSDNEAVHWGNVLEPIVAQEFALRTGRTVQKVDAILQHPEHSFMLANLDYEVEPKDGGEPEILECKTAGWRATLSEEWGDGLDSVPHYYYLQVLHQLAVRGCQRGHLAVLMGGQAFRMYVIDRDEAVIEQLVTIETAFWRSVETRIAPDIRSVADALRAFPISKAQLIEASDDVAEAASRLHDLKKQQKALDEQVDDCKGIISGHMGECDTLVDIGGNPILTWKTQHRKAYSVRESSTRVLRFAKDYEGGIL